MTNINNNIITGYILSTHGVDGTLVIESCSGDFTHFANIKNLTLTKHNDSRLFDVESVDTSHGWLKLKGVDTKEAAMLLKGYAIVVDKSNAYKLKKDEWYIDDLIGCKIIYKEESNNQAQSKDSTATQDSLGVVTDVLDGGNGQLLCIDNSKYIPLDFRYLQSIDTNNKTITLKVRWILE